MKKTINLFVPGRLCIMGEHSDWAGRYRNVNHSINKGYALVTGIEEGIYATASISNKLIVNNLVNNTSFECEMDYNKLKEIAEEGEYYSYVAGVASTIKEEYNVKGVEITITASTLPEKKGLSSSASICVLVTRAFNELYNLHLNTIGEMNVAYKGEIMTPSRCGRLDQACAFGKNPVLMTFDGDKIDVKNIKIEERLYIVFADLMSKKNTIKILADLNRSYPFPQTTLDYKVHECFGIDNEKLVLEAVKYIENGQIDKLGEVMNEAQRNFDEKVTDACPEELSSLVLHKLLNDQYLRKLSYGMKGVGSQGDGSIQILAKDYESQKLIKEYIQKVLGMKPYELTIEPTRVVKKAIIPVAGNGTRMFPITKCIKKAFLPIVDTDGIVKPVILCILEEIIDAGIEEVCLIIDEEDQVEYDKLFNIPLSEDISKKLSPEMLKYESKIHEIGKKIKYVYQKEKLGLGHAVSLCESFADKKPVLLVLGDHVPLSFENKSCTKQFLEFYSKTNGLSVSVCEVNENEVSRYGILCGILDNNKNVFEVEKMIEKPGINEAKEEYYTICNGTKKYYAVFGEYILTEDVFDLLRRNISENKKENGEFQITSVLDEIREKNKLYAFIPEGKMLDVGNTISYKNSFIEKASTLSLRKNV